MIVKREIPSELFEKLAEIRKKIDELIPEYLDLADYGWDSFTETLANVSAQIYMQEIVLKNAKVNETHYF